MKCKRDFAKLRNSLSQMFLKLGVLKSFANFTGKHLCWSRGMSLFLIRLQSWKPTQTPKQVFSCETRTPLFTEHLRWLFIETAEVFWRDYIHQILANPAFIETEIISLQQKIGDFSRCFWSLIFCKNEAVVRRCSVKTRASKYILLWIIHLS